MYQVREEDSDSGREVSIYLFAVICFTMVVYDWGKHGSGDEDNYL
jgi:hypothetical protein